MTYFQEDSKICHMARIRLALWFLSLISLFFSLFLIVPASASPDEVRWSKVNIPLEGKAGNWVLAKGSDVQQLTMASDGTLYGCAKPTGTSYTLFKSTDGGYSWAYTGGVKDDIVDIATASGNASVVCYATSSKVFRSTDAGSTFSLLALNPGGAGSNNVEITSIDVTLAGNDYFIVIGTRDTDNSQFGGVYILEVSHSFTFVDTHIGNYDMCSVAFSPHFAADRQIVAVVTNETDTLVTTKIANDEWGATVGNAGISSTVPVSATILFPADYSSEIGAEQYIQFVATNTGSEGGDVYKVKGNMAPNTSIVTDLNIGSNYGLNEIDVTGLAIGGNAATANLLAGAAGSAQVYFSPDGGSHWTRSIKPPTGESKTCVALAPDFATSGKAYVATSGTESAFSISQDKGITWNQVGLIDTEISDILDVAISPNYSQDNTLFLLTFGGKHSLWRSLNGGAGWERVYSSALAYVDQINLIGLSPQGNSSRVMFIAGNSSGSPVIWKSSDNGQKFIRLAAHDPVTGASFNIDTWAIVSDNTLFVGSFDGTNGVVYRTANSGLFYSTGAVVGSQSLNSLALSPDYENAKAILVGNTNGWVYWSNDDGASFESLPSDTTSPPLTGSITVAFDQDYSRNKTVYAASDSANKGIYRFIIGKSTEWESIDSTLPSGAIISGLATSGDGVLYAANSQQVNMANKRGGMERCLDPTYSLGPKFETIIRGLDDGATLTGLRLNGNRLWAVDSTNVRLLTYTDSLARPVILTSPANLAPGMSTKNVKIEWQTLKGATKYKWQLDYDTDFSSVPAGFEGDTEGSSARLPELELDTKYYWRVRAIEPVLSLWSGKWSFATSLGLEVGSLQLINPRAGEREVPVKPVFQWTVLENADRYELVVSADNSFTNPIIAKVGDSAFSSTAWQCDINLEYDTTHYWKVRAINSNTLSAWSAVGAFTTGSPPKPLDFVSTLAPTPAPALPSQTASPPLSSQPSPQNTPYWAKWLIYLGGALLLVLFAMLITMIIMTRKLFRL